jgi:hypothetical protein
MWSGRITDQSDGVLEHLSSGAVELQLEHAPQLQLVVLFQLVAQQLLELV